MAPIQLASVPPGPAKLPDGWTWWLSGAGRDPRVLRSPEVVPGVRVLRSGWRRTIPADRQAAKQWLLGSRAAVAELAGVAPDVDLSPYESATPCRWNDIIDGTVTWPSVVAWQEECPATDQDPVRPAWSPVVEINQIDPTWEGLGPNGRAYPLDRCARAPQGSPVPEGWSLLEPDDMAAAAPLNLTHGEALQLWQSRGRSVFSTIVVMPRPGGWQVAVGIGGEARTLRGVFADRTDAVAAGDAEILRQRQALPWVAPFPPVRILEAASPGWEALRAADQLPAPTVYGIAEIAGICHVSIDAARKWQQRGALPEPTARLQAGWIWTGPEIDEWLESRLAARPAG